MKRILIPLFLLLCLACCRTAPFVAPTLPQNPDYVADMEGKLDRAAGLFHSYEGVEGPQTPAPCGYKPFYVSHYGRHGSRRQIGSGGTEAYRILNEAAQADNLTPEGEALFQEVAKLYQPTVGMDGELTYRGGQEHQGIAKRMYKRFKPVFSKGGKVHCQSSMIRRCLVSMSNFTGALWSQAPALEMDFVTGEPTQEIIMHDYYEVGEDLAERRSHIMDSLFLALVDTERLTGAYFKDASAIKGPRFAQHLFYIAADAQDLLLEAGPVDVFGHIPSDVLIGLSQFFNENYYIGMANSVEGGAYVRWEAKWLLEDIVTRADQAISEGDRVADLRFGHDSAIMPLACLIGLDPIARSFPTGEAWKNGWYMWKYLCMGSNLQMGFYKNAKGNVLVKFLYNEQEVLIPALETSAPAPYYAWEDLRPYLLALCTDKSLIIP